MKTPLTDKNVFIAETHGLPCGDGPLAVIEVVRASFARELEYENMRLRAIFPKVLAALKSGACSSECTADFFELIPSEVEAVIQSLRSSNKQISNSDPSKTP